MSSRTKEKKSGHEEHEGKKSGHEEHEGGHEKHEEVKFFIFVHFVNLRALRDRILFALFVTSFCRGEPVCG